MTRWGIVATLKAPLAEIQRFAAWHLHLGAARLYLYLDDANAEAARALGAHPQITAIPTDAAYWAAHGHRPGKHQVRQSHNATHAAAQAAGVLDWLAHIDGDEFLLPEGAPGRSVAACLAALPETALCARVRPAEALAPGGAERPGETLFKALHPDPQTRRAAARAAFGPWGDVLSGGFISHVAGKLFLRPAAGAWSWRIHNAWLEAAQNPGEAALPALPLGHFHAPDYAQFAAKRAFRMKRGSYRAELRPALRTGAVPNLNTVLRDLEAERGEDGLRAFYDAVNRATPAVADALEGHGLLIRRRMDLEACAASVFGPNAAADPL